MALKLLSFINSRLLHGFFPKGEAAYCQFTEFRRLALNDEWTGCEI